MGVTIVTLRVVLTGLLFVLWGSQRRSFIDSEMGQCRATRILVTPLAGAATGVTFVLLSLGLLIFAAGPAV